MISYFSFLHTFILALPIASYRLQCKHTGSLPNISYFVGSLKRESYIRIKMVLENLTFDPHISCSLAYVNAEFIRFYPAGSISSLVSTRNRMCLIKDIIIYCYFFIHFVHFPALHIQLSTVVFVMAATTTTASAYNLIVHVICEMFDLWIRYYLVFSILLNFA